MAERTAFKLGDPAFIAIPLGQIKPQGWLADQLRIQADGLTGHLAEFWPDIASSGWIGGQSEGWERGPYWLDGAIPLAHLLNDQALKDRVSRWIDHILQHQHADGWLGPIQSGKYEVHDPWPVFVMLKALTQYYETVGDERVIDAMRRFLRRLDGLLDERPLFSWGKSRWADLVLSIHWLHRRIGEPWLLDLAAKAQAQGFDWHGHFAQFPFTEKTRREAASQISHVVNNAMAVKAPGVWHVQSHDPADRQGVYTIIEALDRHHGQATGIFSGDEHLAGRNPSQGTELCAVVEYMFSLETLIGILGDPALADRLEAIAFNALPGTCTPDMWAHQYDQQANQVRCNVGKHVWTTNGDDANIFGLEPNYGCCTANMHQGWPKFAAHLWLRTPQGGLVAPVYGPCRVSTRLPQGEHVTIEEETEYPFGETVRLRISTDRPAAFPLVLRIPGWAKKARLVAAGEEVRVTAGTFVAVNRTWRDGDAVELTLPMAVTCERRFNQAVSLRRGPLVFSLRIGERFDEVRQFGPARDYEVWPTTPWNYALEIDCDRPEASVSVETGPISRRPFDPAHPPVTLKAAGRRLPSWGLEPDLNDAAPPPPSPVRTNAPREDLSLIPYGSAHLRITEFPVVER